MQKTNTKKTLFIAYQEFADSLYSYGCKFTNDGELVKDCIHDVFVRMYEKTDISQVRDMQFYLLRSFKNRLIDELSKTKTIEISDDVPFLIPNNITVEDLFLKDEETKRIKKQIDEAMSKLTNRQREAVYLYYIEELDYEHICQLMDMNYQSVRNLVHRGISRLRDNMESKALFFLYIFILNSSLQRHIESITN